MIFLFNNIHRRYTCQFLLEKFHDSLFSPFSHVAPFYIRCTETRRLWQRTQILHRLNRRRIGLPRWKWKWK